MAEWDQPDLICLPSRFVMSPSAGSAVTTQTSLGPLSLLQENYHYAAVGMSI